MSNKIRRQSTGRNQKNASAPPPIPNLNLPSNPQLERQKMARKVEKITSSSSSFAKPKIISFRWKFKNTNVTRSSVGIPINKLFEINKEQKYSVELKILQGFNSTGKNDGRRGHQAYLHFDNLFKKKNDVIEVNPGIDIKDMPMYCLILEPTSHVQYVNRNYTTFIKGEGDKILSMKLTFMENLGDIKRTNFIDFNENCISVLIQIKVNKVK